MNYEKKPTVPRSYGNISHKRNSYRKASELGARLAWVKGQTKMPGRRETKIARKRRGVGNQAGESCRTRSGQVLQDVGKNFNFLINATRRHRKVLIMGVVSVLHLKTIVLFFREWRNILPQPTAIADGNRNRSGHLTHCDSYL